MKKREKLPKVRVTKHGNTYIPSVKELPNPIHIDCPECGETWAGYKEQMDCEFLGIFLASSLMLVWLNWLDTKDLND